MWLGRHRMQGLCVLLHVGKLSCQVWVAGGRGASSAHLVLQKVSEEPGCSQNPYSPWPRLGREA